MNLIATLFILRLLSASRDFELVSDQKELFTFLKMVYSSKGSIESQLNNISKPHVIFILFIILLSSFFLNPNNISFFFEIDIRGYEYLSEIKFYR